METLNTLDKTLEELKKVPQIHQKDLDILTAEQILKFRHSVRSILEETERLLTLKI